MTGASPSGEDAGGVSPDLAVHGKVSYLQLPAFDPRVLGAFYQQVFGWHVGGSQDHVSFRDTSGHLIGAFVTGREPAGDRGPLPFVYVDRIDVAIARLKEHGADIERAPYPEGDLWVATFRDPQGNLLGIWQAGPR